jgi:hypothetical protein
MGSSEKGCEPSGCKEGREFLELLSGYQLLMKVPTSWSYFTPHAPITYRAY